MVGTSTTPKKLPILDSGISTTADELEDRLDRLDMLEENRGWGSVNGIFCGRKNTIKKATVVRCLI